MNELYVPNENLLRVLAGGIVAWFALLAVLWAMRVPGRPRPGPDSTDLGSEEPALANLLVHRFNPTRDAVPATLVDLAARGLIEIEDRGIGRYYCRLTGETEALTPYEQMLVDHLRSVAADGVVPAEALTTGPQDRSKAWWGEFRKGIVEQGQSWGLCADLWSRRGQLLLGGFGVALLLFYGFVTGFNEADDVADSPLLNAGTFGLLAVVLAMAAVSKSKRQTSTDAGLRAASRWLGVKRALEESPSFEILPPSGVAVWERHLAYAAALGVAPRSIHALPMGAESDTEAWTASSGEWRKVKVTYPRFRPGWGRHPLLALAIGGLGTFAGFNVVRVATRDIGFDESWLATAGTVGTALGVVMLARSLPQVALGFLDLFSRRRVSGTVLRARTRWSPFPYPVQTNDRENVRYFLALDDTRSTSVTAYRVKPDLYERYYQGAEADLEITPNLGHVRRPSA